MYNVNILVNGSNCKQYFHEGKTFIESKLGSEYVIEVKNGTWSRVLAVCSVDGLDILNGKPATENGPGYVINALASSKFDGFRVSDDKVAKFVFTTKDDPDAYAKTKDDGSEKNVGVIGVRIFTEKLPPPPPPPVVIYHPQQLMWNQPYFGDPIITSTNHGQFMFDKGGTTITYGCNNIPTNSSGLKARSANNSANTLSNTVRAMNTSFDMATKWGEAKESRTIEVEFERGILALSTNIYYASRQSLIEMGIPLGNEKQVNFPEPFAEKYAKPPKNWKG